LEQLHSELNPLTTYHVKPRTFVDPSLLLNHRSAL
jgi:hypothetical protein